MSEQQVWVALRGKRSKWIWAVGTGEEFDASMFNLSPGAYATWAEEGGQYCKLELSTASHLLVGMKVDNVLHGSIERHTE